MVKLDLYWKSNPKWFTRNGFDCKIKPDAPKEAQESYKHYLQQMKEHNNHIS